MFDAPLQSDMAHLMEMLDVSGITEDEAVARINQYMKTASAAEINGLAELLAEVREKYMDEMNARNVPFDTQQDGSFSIEARRVMAGQLIDSIKGAEEVQAAATEKLKAMQESYVQEISQREALTMQNRTLREIYDAEGYTVIWKSSGTDCRLCSSMDNKPVGEWGKEARIRKYPPLHKGCTCQIVALRKPLIFEEDHGTIESGTWYERNIEGKPEMEARYMAAIQKAKETTRMRGEVMIPRVPEHLSEFKFDNAHMNDDRKHGVTREEAERYVRNALVMVNKKRGIYIDYYGLEGSTYIEGNGDLIRTAFKADEYEPNIYRFLEVIISELRTQ